MTNPETNGIMTKERRVDGVSSKQYLVIDVICAKNKKKLPMGQDARGWIFLSLLLFSDANEESVEIASCNIKKCNTVNF